MGVLEVAQLAQETYNSNVLQLLIDNLTKLDFEAKKDVAQIFNNLLRRQIGTRSPTVEYVHSRPQMLDALVRGYESQDIAVTCGSMLRECIRHENLAKLVLRSSSFYNFFSYVELSTFDIASDAFSTFKELITRHKALCADFLESNYESFFEYYEKLLHSENYVTRRQSLKLMMNMLREKSRSIQFEAFHVFKVCVFFFPKNENWKNRMGRSSLDPPTVLCSRFCVLE
ncbi:unnamed protein product [Gongylonema pulchrum]|uniref:Protein Mo25 n=1 Tax=Gongylonema pulchrum TaxID=637853 RepID=A0A183EGD8_9BILA|nr:unnamed protein product [Gongylonema pulchrum]